MAAYPPLNKDTWTVVWDEAFHPKPISETASPTYPDHYYTLHELPNNRALAFVKIFTDTIGPTSQQATLEFQLWQRDGSQMVLLDTYSPGNWDDLTFDPEINYASHAMFNDDYGVFAFEHVNGSSYSTTDEKTLVYYWAFNVANDVIAFETPVLVAQGKFFTSQGAVRNGGLVALDETHMALVHWFLHVRYSPTFGMRRMFYIEILTLDGGAVTSHRIDFTTLMGHDGVNYYPNPEGNRQAYQTFAVSPTVIGFQDQNLAGDGRALTLLRLHPDLTGVAQLYRNILDVPVFDDIEPDTYANDSAWVFAVLGGTKLVISTYVQIWSDELQDYTYHHASAYYNVFGYTYLELDRGWKAGGGPFYLLRNQIPDPNYWLWINDRLDPVVPSGILGKRGSSIEPSDQILTNSNAYHYVGGVYQIHNFAHLHTLEGVSLGVTVPYDFYPQGFIGAAPTWSPRFRPMGDGYYLAVSGDEFDATTEGVTLYLIKIGGTIPPLRLIHRDDNIPPSGSSGDAPRLVQGRSTHQQKRAPRVGAGPNVYW